MGALFLLTRIHSGEICKNGKPEDLIFVLWGLLQIPVLVQTSSSLQGQLMTARQPDAL